MKISKEQKINMLAIELLEHRGCYKPNQQQIDKVELRLQRMREMQNVYVEKPLSSIHKSVATAL